MGGECWCGAQGNDVCRLSFAIERLDVDESRRMPLKEEEANKGCLRRAEGRRNAGGVVASKAAETNKLYER